jgi:hypothetical protein
MVTEELVIEKRAALMESTTAMSLTTGCFSKSDTPRNVNEQTAEIIDPAIPGTISVG